ncbi:hypothetical protein LOTGIDRAFT_238697 [Lottia gigantea]|uniref:UMA domain-containing protein n=1 Tax=Lottia gigantea TaxID=225164 RepID=V4A768_LOTGI|nr:hypothetical protein LOTGIDRAFT_238697 [Lottia gigantea]ESO99788.1 hypothetical protein LOTGIDRAFT_238697 [Lottia gigantea]
MFSSLISKIKEITHPVPSQQPVEYPECNDNDLNEDGFLVLGETQSDREAINGGTFDPNSVDTPPTYDQVMTAPVLSNQPSVFPTSLQTTLPLDGGRTPITAISDVPFKLAPSLAIVKDIQEDSSFSFICDTRPINFNWKKYDYDFSAEESVLRDYCLNGNDFNHYQ